MKKKKKISFRKPLPLKTGGAHKNKKNYNRKKERTRLRDLLEETGVFY